MRILTLDDLARDFRFAFRSLARQPGLAVAAIACLALGIGANAAIFSVVDAVLLRPLPFPEAERLVRLYETYGGDTTSRGAVSIANVRDWRRQATVFEGLAAFTLESRNLQGAAEPVRVSALAADPQLFRVLRVAPLLGRTFTAAEARPGAERVAVLGEGLWRERFGGDRRVLGRAVTLDGAPHTVIGVLPERADLPPGGEPAALWLPFVPFDPENRGAHFLNVVARLRPGATLAQAEEQMRVVAARIAQADPEPMAGRSAVVLPFREAMTGDVRPALLVLLGAVAAVLLIACANVANLLLARAAGRRQEMALREVLGASRAVRVRQLLVESLVLALAGAAAGAFLAWVGVAALRPWAAETLPVAGAIALDLRVFGFLLALAVASALVFGLAPAVQTAGAALHAHLAEGSGRASGGRGQQRLRDALVVAEIALSLVLLVASGLLVRSFLLLRATDPGLDPAGVLTAHVAVPEGRYEPGEATPRLLAPVLERVRALPGVEAAGAISLLPIQDAWTNASYWVEGRPAPPPGQAPFAELRVVSPGVFAALGVPLLAGRGFDERDGTGEAVVLVNEALARLHFPPGEAVGKRLIDLGGETFTIAGVVGDVRQAGLDQEPLPEVYIPYRHEFMNWMDEMTLVVRASGDPAALAPAVRDAVRAVDPGQPVYGVLTMEEVIGESLRGRRLSFLLLGVFAAMALLLATIGLYGVIAYLVSQRRREIGIRMALGARPGDVAGMVLRRGAALTGVGLVLGLAGALFAVRLLEGMLYGVEGREPVLLALPAALLAAAALLATWLPSRRAARLDPVVALQGDGAVRP